MHETGQRVAAARVDGLLQGVEHEVRAHRGRHPPAHDAPREDVDHERHVGEPTPGRHVSEV